MDYSKEKQRFSWLKVENRSSKGCAVIFWSFVSVHNYIFGILKELLLHLNKLINVTLTLRICGFLGFIEPESKLYQSSCLCIIQFLIFLELSCSHYILWWIWSTLCGCQKPGELPHCNRRGEYECRGWEFQVPWSCQRPSSYYKFVNCTFEVSTNFCNMLFCFFFLNVNFVFIFTVISDDHCIATTMKCIAVSDRNFHFA